jgi:hypothetical protein
MKIDFEQIRAEVTREVADRTISDIMDTANNGHFRGFSESEREELNEIRLHMKYALDAAEVFVRKYHEQLAEKLRSHGINLE